MDLQTRKLKMIEKIIEMDENSLHKLESSFKKILDDSISIKEYDQELDKAVAEIERGEYLDHKSAVKKVREYSSINQD
jgi:hypothetical protein